MILKFSLSVWKLDVFYSVGKVLRLRFCPRDKKKPALQKFPRIESTLSKCFVLVIVLIETCRRKAS